MMKAKKNRQKKASPLFFIAVALCVSLSAGLVAYAAWLVHGNSAGNSVTIGAPTVLTIGEDNEAVFTAGDGALDGPGAELVKSVTVKISAGSAQFSLFVTRFSITGGEAEYDERDLYYQVSPDKSDGSWTARAAFIAPETDEDLDAPNPDRLYLIRNGAVSAGSPATVFLKIGLGEETGDGEHPAASLAGQTVSFTIAAGLPQQDFAPYTIGKDTMANGSVTVQSGANAGESVTVTAVPAMGYALDTLTVYKTGDAFTTVEVSDGAFTMPAYDVTVAATFKKINSAITKGAETNGTVTVVANADYGDSVTLTAVPAAGYHVASLAVYKTGDADTAGEVSGDAFTMPAFGVTIDLVCAPDDNTAYKVQIYTEGLDGEFSEVTADEFSAYTDGGIELAGTTGTTVDASTPAVDYVLAMADSFAESEGYARDYAASGSIESGTVSGDSTLVLKFYYKIVLEVAIGEVSGYGMATMEYTLPVVAAGYGSRSVTPVLTLEKQSGEDWAAVPEQISGGKVTPSSGGVYRLTASVTVGNRQAVTDSKLFDVLALGEINAFDSAAKRANANFYVNGVNQNWSLYTGAPVGGKDPAVAGAFMKGVYSGENKSAWTGPTMQLPIMATVGQLQTLLSAGYRKVIVPIYMEYKESDSDHPELYKQLIDNNAPTGFNNWSGYAAAGTRVIGYVHEGKWNNWEYDLAYLVSLVQGGRNNINLNINCYGTDTGGAVNIDVYFGGLYAVPPESVIMSFGYDLHTWSSNVQTAFNLNKAQGAITENYELGAIGGRNSGQVMIGGELTTLVPDSLGFFKVSHTASGGGVATVGYDVAAGLKPGMVEQLKTLKNAGKDTVVFPMYVSPQDGSTTTALQLQQQAAPATPNDPFSATTVGNALLNTSWTTYAGGAYANQSNVSVGQWHDIKLPIDWVIHCLDTADNGGLNLSRLINWRSPATPTNYDIYFGPIYADTIL